MTLDEEIKPIYNGRIEDFKWIGFGSGSGTNLEACAKVRPPAYIFTDKPSAKLRKLERLVRVPTIVLNGYEACGSWQKAQGNQDAEAEYQRRSDDFNGRIFEALKKAEGEMGKPFDLIVLGGYMRLVGKQILDAYRDRVINVHPSKLPVRANGGKTQRVLVGMNAVYDAIILGNAATASSVILVDEGVDHGEKIVEGPDVHVDRKVFSGNNGMREELTRTYASFHQLLQKMESDWPAITTALRFIAEGRVALGTMKRHHDEWRNR